MNGGSWEPDFEVVLRFVRRRWWSEVKDLLMESQGERLAFDDLDLDKDLAELGNAVGPTVLARLAVRSLTAAAPEPEDDPALRAVEAPEPALARAFVRLLGANLAFTLRSDEVLLALAASANAAAPKLEPSVLGALLSRARSARDARALIARSSLPAAMKAEATSAVKSLARAGDFAVLHARTSPEELGEGLARLHARRELAPAPWGAGSAERAVATRPRGGFSTLVVPGGVPRELAAQLSGAAPGLGRIVWCERAGDAARFAVFEGGRVVDDETRLAARVGQPLERDDVMGALRALGITAHDEAAPGELTSFVFEDYATETSGPASLRKQRAVGLAFLPAKEARRLEREAERDRDRRKSRERERKRAKGRPRK
jgi:hypothetical protein